jgi:hypothetical protein
MKPRLITITRAKLIDQRRQSVPKSAVAGLFHAEPTEMGFRGIYSAWTILKLFGSSDFVNTDRKPLFKGAVRKSHSEESEIPDYTDQLSAAPAEIRWW